MSAKNNECCLKIQLYHSKTGANLLFPESNLLYLLY